MAEPTETIKVDTTTVNCDGGAKELVGALGHPRVYLHIKPEYPEMMSMVGNNVSKQRIAIQKQIIQMVNEQRFLITLAWVNALWGGSKRIADYPRVPGATMTPFVRAGLALASRNCADWDRSVFLRTRLISGWAINRPSASRM